MGRARDEMKVEIRLAKVENDNGRLVPGVIGRCTECDHEVKCFGQSDRSDKRVCVLMSEECPHNSGYFYVPDRIEEEDDDDDAANPASPYREGSPPVARQITRHDSDPPGVQDLMVYRTYAAAALSGKTKVDFAPIVVMSLLNSIDTMIAAMDAQKRLVAKAIEAWKRNFGDRPYDPTSVLDWLVASRADLEAMSADHPTHPRAASQKGSA